MSTYYLVCLCDFEGDLVLFKAFHFPDLLKPGLCMIVPCSDLISSSYHRSAIVFGTFAFDPCGGVLMGLFEVIRLVVELDPLYHHPSPPSCYFRRSGARVVAMNYEEDPALDVVSLDSAPMAQDS